MLLTLNNYQILGVGGCTGYVGVPGVGIRGPPGHEGIRGPPGAAISYLELRDLVCDMLTEIDEDVGHDFHSNGHKLKKRKHSTESSSSSSSEEDDGTYDTEDDSSIQWTGVAVPP